MSNPYQRPFLLRSLEIEPKETKYLTEALPDFLVDLINGLGMYLIRPHLKKGSKAPEIFRKKRRKTEEQDDGIMTVPDGRGGFRKVKMVKNV